MGNSRIAILSGACGGIGLACSRRLGRAYRLVLTDRDAAALDREAEALRAAGIEVAATKAADLRDPAAIDELVVLAARAGDLLALVHTAGVSSTMADWRTVLEINLIAAERLSDAVLERAAAGIVAIFITSIATANAPRNPDLDAVLDHPLAPDFLDRIGPFLGLLGERFPASAFAYAVSKYGLARHVRRRVHRFAAKRGRVVGLAPGIIDTPMGRAETAPGTALAGITQVVPLRRLGLPDEIAAVVEFLASDAASFVTGCDWTVDGGLTAMSTT